MKNLFKATELNNAIMNKVYALDNTLCSFYGETGLVDANNTILRFSDIQHKDILRC